MVKLLGIKTILLDIEGTICPITFVKDVMYPSALTTLKSLLNSTPNYPPEQLTPYLPSFPPTETSSPSAFLTHIAHLTTTDSKSAPLKNLQGFLWRTGFANGSLKAPLYPDVPVALRKWKAQGKELGIFSSGSVEAQKLFLGYTGVEGVEGGDSVDLTSLFGGGHFDTVNAGAKGQEGSYVKIAKEMGVEEKVVLFLSDNVNEVRAALTAGMKSLIVDRPGNAPLTEQDRQELTVITNFDEIELEGSEA